MAGSNRVIFLELLKNPIDPTKRAPLEDADSLFLVNLESNPDEIRNEASTNPEKVVELSRLYAEWYGSIGQQ